MVSVYLLTTALWLRMTGAIPRIGLRRILKAQIRQPYAGKLGDFAHESGLCWLAKVPDDLLSDMESVSRVALTEDGRPLGPKRSGHDEIRRIGLGRYSHFGSQIYFSTSDNSDPRSNGRTYAVEESSN